MRKELEVSKVNPLLGISEIQITKYQTVSGLVFDTHREAVSYELRERLLAALDVYFETPKQVSFNQIVDFMFTEPAMIIEALEIYRSRPPG